MKPKKLIRGEIVTKIKEYEWEFIKDQDELNKLYALKVQEELEEIQSSGHKDIMEFVDLIQVAFAFAKQNGYTQEQLSLALVEKTVSKGIFSNVALNDLNPNNPSNKLYFKKEEGREQFHQKPNEYGEDGMLQNLRTWDWIVTKTGVVKQITGDDMMDLKAEDIARFATEFEVKYRTEK